MIDNLTFALISSKLFVASILDNFAAVKGCNTAEGHGFFGFPTWYKYLPGQEEPGGGCVPSLNHIGDLWLVLLAVIEMLLRVAVLAAIAYLIFGGFKYIIARGNSDKIAQAKTAVIDSLVGLFIAIAAVAVVNFIGKSVGGN